MPARTALGCAIILLAAILIMGIIYRGDGWRFWRRKTVLCMVAMILLAFAITLQSRSLYQSFIQKCLSPNATYADVYRRMSEAAANHLDVAVGTFGMWSVALVFTTFALLGVAARQTVATMRHSRRPTPRSTDAL